MHGQSQRSTGDHPDGTRIRRQRATTVRIVPARVRSPFADPTPAGWRQASSGTRALSGLWETGPTRRPGEGGERVRCATRRCSSDTASTSARSTASSSTAATRSRSDTDRCNELPVTARRVGDHPESSPGAITGSVVCRPPPSPGPGGTGRTARRPGVAPARAPRGRAGARSRRPRR